MFDIGVGQSNEIDGKFYKSHKQAILYQYFENKNEGT